MFTDIDIGIVLSVLGIVTGLALGIGLFFITIYAKIIADETSTDRTNLLVRLEGRGGWVATYETWLRRLLDWLDCFFEQVKTPPRRPRYLTARSFDRCLLLAVIYPLTSAILGWFIFGDAGSLGTALGLEAEPTAFVHWGWGVYALVIGIFAFNLVSRDRSLLAVIVVMAAFYGPSLLGAPAPTAVAFAFAFADMFAFTAAAAAAVAGAAAAAVAGAGAVAFAGALALAVAGAFAGVFAFAFAFAVAGVFAFAVAVAGAGAYTMKTEARSHMHWWVIGPHWMFSER